MSTLSPTTVALFEYFRNASFRPPGWRSGPRHCIAVLAVPQEILGSSTGSVAAGHDRETHGVAHNWPSVVRVMGGFGRQGGPFPIAY